MYNVKNMAQPPDEPAGVAENGGQFAISRETDKAASCWAGLLLRDAIPFPLHFFVRFSRAGDWTRDVRLYSPPR